MKKLLMTLGLVALLVPTIALAAEFKYPSPDSGSVKVKSTEQAKNLYICGSSVSVDGNVSRDLVAVGSDVKVSGNVEDSALLFGSSVGVSGDVGGNVRTAGSAVTISSSVTGDVLAAGSTVTLGSEGKVAGDFLAAAGTLDLAGDVSGNVTATAGTVNISGHIVGDIKLQNVASLTVADKTVIDGKLTYYSNNKADIDHDAVITGGVTRNNISETEASGHYLSAGITGVILLTKILGSFLFLLLLIYLLPKTTKNFVEVAASDIWSSLAWGLLLLIVVPIAAVLAMALIAPVGISIAVLLAYVIAVMVSSTAACLLAGVGLHKLVKKNKEPRIDWLTAIIGVVVITILSLVPIISGLIFTILFLISFGTFARMVGSFIKANKK